VGEVLLFTVSFALGIAVPAWVVRRDLTRLKGEALSRAWPDASLWAAAVMFGPLCLPVHFMKTRRNWRGVALGVAWFAGALLLISLPVELLGWLFGVSD
jgi:ribosomal protein L39E